jgi:SPFH domain/Band 7 family protein
MELPDQVSIQKSAMSRIFLAAAVIVGLIFVFSIGGNLFENVDANEIMVLQAVPSGALSVYTTPGWKWQGFGKVTKYHKRGQFWFRARGDQGAKEDHSMRLRFNDGGHATVSGSFAYEMPITAAQVIMLHMKYGSEIALEQQLIQPSAERAAYFSGPLMSSTESYASRRSDLLNYMEDQLQRGLYKTQRRDLKVKDTITGEEKTASIVEIAQDEKATPLRQEPSPLGTFGIRTFNLSFNEIKYEDTVENQIKQQQQMQMAVQTAIAEAKQAEQQRITTEQNGMAQAARAKWDQEVIKAKEVTAAQQRLAVAELDAKAADQEKRAMTLRGEGEGAYRRAKIAGDNALDQRLAAWVEVQKSYAEALGGATVPWVPTVSVGGGAGGGALNAQQYLELLGIKAAKDLAVDMNMATAKK